MTEISFARSFLSALDLRPVKLGSDYVADPKEYAAQSAPILPKHSNQPLKRKRGADGAAAQPAAPGSEPSLDVTLKNLKSAETVTLRRQALGASVYDLKSAYATQTSGNVEKTKLLYNKKPVADSKTIKELIVADGGAPPKEIVFSVMVMGGGVSQPSAGRGAGEAPVVAEGKSGQEVLRDESFWEDLRAFLLQRVRDESEATSLSLLFRKAWEAKA